MASPEPSEHPAESAGPRKREPLGPTARKRLQKCFELAGKQTAQDNFDYATELFSQCVLGDPGNPVYVQNFVGNLQRKFGNNKKGSSLAQFKERGARRAVKKAVSQSDWDEAIKNGIPILKINPWDVPTLKAMATASAAIAAEGEGGLFAGYGECELYYLKCAVEAAPNDPAVCQQLGTALGKRQRFDEAIAFWHRVEKVRPDDEEVRRAIATLAVEKTIVQGKWDEKGGAKRPGGGKPGGAQQEDETLAPEERLKRRIGRQPDDMPAYTELAQLYLSADRYKEAAEVYEQALKVSNDLNIRETLEDIQIREVRARMVAADKRFKQSAIATDKAEFDKLRKEVYNKELALYKSRCERFPNKLEYRYELAVRHMLLGQYNEAIRELQVARSDPRNKGRCLLALGECFEHVKQPRLAMGQYEAAIQEIPDRDTENKKKVLYRIGKLAFRMNDIPTSERHLTTLAAMDYAYRDVSALLDKIAKRRNDEGPDGEKPPEA
jgi:tetratricopeptide (TPR) repeat protein